MHYELATLSCPLMAIGIAANGVQSWVNSNEARGRVLGCWRSEIGTLGRLLILRGFDHHQDMVVERRRAMLSVNPFNAANVATGLEMESYAPFPFLPLVEARSWGGVYEFRTYRLRPGGLSPTLTGWEAAIDPAWAYTQHLVINMYALDGAPRITHIWGFANLEQRRDLRDKHYAAGLWPPRGAPEQIVEAKAMIALPLAGSPLS